MLDRLFLAHPRSIDEGYLEHQGVAFSFAGALLLAAGRVRLARTVPGAL